MEEDLSPHQLLLMLNSSLLDWLQLHIIKRLTPEFKMSTAGRLVWWAGCRWVDTRGGYTLQVPNHRRRFASRMKMEITKIPRLHLLRLKENLLVKKLLQPITIVEDLVDLERLLLIFLHPKD